MLEPPALDPDQIAGCLDRAFGLPDAQAEFLPLGADLGTAVYRVTAGGSAYFFKLRRGAPNEASVRVPWLLSKHGVPHLITPLPAGNGQLWAALDGYTAILYPYVDGQDGYAKRLTDDQWVAFGAAVRRIHDMPLPPDLVARLPYETYPARWRDMVRAFMTDGIDIAYDDPVAARMAAFLQRKRTVVLDLIDWNEALAHMLQAQDQAYVLCHADLHAGNVLINGDQFYIVDWDTLILAPRERDLMYPGGAQGFGGRSPAAEEALFYQGYGPVAPNPLALGYYRGARILEDIAIACEQVFLNEAGGADRAQEFTYLRHNFEPHGTLAAAYRVGQLDYGRTD